MHHRALSISIVITLPLLAIACDASSLGGVGSSSDAAAGFRAVLGALNGNSPAAQHRADNDAAFREADLGGDVDVSGACSEGGSVAFEGTLEITGAAGANLDNFDPFDPDDKDIEVSVPSVSFAYTVTFDDCVEDGVHIDGSMTWSLSTDWDRETRVLSMAWDFNGSVEFDGAANGHCDFDFSGSASSDSAEGWGDVDADAYSGSACGYDAEDVLD